MGEHGRGDTQGRSGARLRDGDLPEYAGERREILLVLPELLRSDTAGGTADQFWSRICLLRVKRVSDGDSDRGDADSDRAVLSVDSNGPSGQWVDGQHSSERHPPGGAPQQRPLLTGSEHEERTRNGACHHSL